jgi:hypothetical protein
LFFSLEMILDDLFDFTEPMKALSFWQPWASLVAAGVKAHDTRDWSTPYRGLIAIHAAKTLDVAGAPEELCRAALGARWARIIPIGMVVAIARLTACVETRSALARDLTPADLEAGTFTPGRVAWRLEDVRALLRPIPAIGRQTLFNWTPPADLANNLTPVINHREACRLIGWGDASGLIAA